MANSIFMTGGTGFLGTEIAAELINYTEEKVYILVRAENMEAAYHRLKTAWYPFPELRGKIGSQFIPVIGDFTLPDLGLSSQDREMLLSEVDRIFHVGAEVMLQKDSQELIAKNRKGTKHVLSLGIAIHRHHGLSRFVHVSTSYVAGQRSGRIMEEDELGNSFSTQYEKTKAQAEIMVKRSGLPYSICRPGMIVGDSRTGWVKNFNTVYYVWKLLLTGNYRIFPVDKYMGLNMVPVDYIAQATAKIAFASEACGKTFHLTCPKELQPNSEDVMHKLYPWVEKNLGMKLPEPIYVPIPMLKKAGITYNKKKSGRKKNVATNLLTLLPYFYGDQEFDRTNTDAIVGEYPLHWQDYLERLLEFACRKNFMHQTERNVFEQARTRRASEHFPINYHDITADGIQDMSGPEVNDRIQQIANALWAWGLRKGDRIALTGINSVDYMTLDQAIGLIGAVSVPIYYTSPIEEAELLLQRSGAKWFFVGDRRIMEHMDRLQADVQVVAFSGGLTVPLANAMPWADFLAAGKEAAPNPYTDPEDLATIRYTSGTTGEPKGVMFNFHQLAWMGEVLTNLLPWEDRNRSLRYLSFLPQSHVVEGILAAYAPYYMLAKVDFYYLNDFGALVDTLPKVRPTVFFSVPRFYEKLWDQLAANPVGQRYLAMEDGPQKKALAVVLKRIILKKAGLDACKQLIVGSAPISEALLLNFRALGIEIHNAYGQTEAPLITINRMGDNIIPTIGTPLPDTTVTAAPDGELIVTGPQVALGYYGLETDTIRDGVLKTGDLGTIHQDGHITLHGRKKEMIVTSYGKNISIPKIEEMLKNIPCVSEAVLIGENRPYCTALLWLEGDAGNLAASIEAMNSDLSHPEQIRRYTIIEEPLSIQAGELTPNLKVKRKKVEEHRAAEIEAMYR